MSGEGAKWHGIQQNIPQQGQPASQPDDQLRRDHVGWNLKIVEFVPCSSRVLSHGRGMHLCGITGRRQLEDGRSGFRIVCSCRSEKQEIEIKLL